MKKEKLIAGILGALVGLILAIFILSRFESSETKKGPSESISPKKQKSVQPTILPIRGIEVSYPKEKAVIKAKEVKIKAQVPKNSLVILVSPVFEKAIFSKSGKLEEDVKLSMGENVIKIYAYPSDPTISNLEKEIIVYRIEKEI